MTPHVELVDSIKFLDVEVDKYLVWDEQIKSAQAKVSHSLGFLKYAKKIFAKKCSLQIIWGYRRAIFSTLLFCVGNCAESRIVKLQKLQNREATIITNSSYDAPAEALIKEVKRPTVREMIRCETATTVFQSVNDLAPGYLGHLFNRNSDRNTINQRNAESDLLVPS